MASWAVFTGMSDSFLTFESHRQRLLGVAYRMLGSRAEAEDIVQEAYLRWHGVAAADVRSPEGWLVTTVTRLCIDHLRLARTARETYVGPWLPEPLVGDASSAVDATAELASNLSIAFLVVLERLSPKSELPFCCVRYSRATIRKLPRSWGRAKPRVVRLQAGRAVACTSRSRGWK